MPHSASLAAPPGATSHDLRVPSSPLGVPLSGPSSSLGFELPELLIPESLHVPDVGQLMVDRHGFPEVSNGMCKCIYEVIVPERPTLFG